VLWQATFECASQRSSQLMQHPSYCHVVLQNTLAMLDAPGGATLPECLQSHTNVQSTQQHASASASSLHSGSSAEPFSNCPPCTAAGPAAPDALMVSQHQGQQRADDKTSHHNLTQQDRGHNASSASTSHLQGNGALDSAEISEVTLHKRRVRYFEKKKMLQMPLPSKW
jgi:hypothetical protein